MRDGISYRKWSAQAVLNEIHLAGWRLANLLTQALEAPAYSPVSVPVEVPAASASPNEKAP